MREDGKEDGRGKRERRDRGRVRECRRKGGRQKKRVKKEPKIEGRED